tara:strand:- start:732 stop:845 length:114 start_codon:yes stop_codon:yes gene_type:complete
MYKMDSNAVMTKKLKDKIKPPKVIKPRKKKLKDIFAY